MVSGPLVSLATWLLMTSGGCVVGFICYMAIDETVVSVSLVSLATWLLMTGGVCVVGFTCYMAIDDQWCLSGWFTLPTYGY